MSNQETDRTKLTFSQAEGIDPLPQPTALGELPQNARVFLWNTTYESLSNALTSPSRLYGDPTTYIKKPWAEILRGYHTACLYQPVDEFSPDFQVQASKIKCLFVEGDFNRVLDFLLFVLRHKSVPYGFSEAAESVLSGCMCAYTVVGRGRTTIIAPIVLPEQRKSIEEAFQVLKSGSFEGVQSHLRKSAECINNGNMAGSVRESIHAVESVARRLAPDAKKTLTPALDALSQKVKLHGAFKKGMENFYGYTNDEEGIRHAQLGRQPNVDKDDAVFMFGACTSFAAYLVNKARKAGLLRQQGFSHLRG